MARTVGSGQETRERGTRFASTDPRTGEVVDYHPVSDEAAVRSAVVRAREAAVWWGGLGFDGRRRRLLSWRSRLARRIDELAGLITAETGKPRDDARLEWVLVVAHLDWAARNAERVLRRRRVGSGLLMAQEAATLEYQPYGVIGVIGPWNYPAHTPMGSIGYALAAGNAVVFKPSELTPGVGRALAESLAEVVPEHPLLQVITGFGETGAALCRAGVDKIAFTGSTATAKKVMATCAENLVPVLMECGGKDAMIVDDDADVAAAADAALWGGMSNAGQTCIGIERVYATDAVYDDFVSELTSKAGKLRGGSDQGASYGPITMPGQLGIIRRHLADARERGGRFLTGGGTEGSFVEPTVLVDVPEDSDAVREETFGPTLTVARVRDAEEALARSNATTYGLAGAVFSTNAARALDLARRMRSGMTSINSVIAFASVPGLPFGGVGDSGFGRIHGPDGLKEFTRAKAITRQRFALPVPLMSFSRPEKVTDHLARVVGLLHGRVRPRGVSADSTPQTRGPANSPTRSGPAQSAGFSV